MNIHRHHRRKGAVLVIALVLGLTLAITVGSFVSLSLNALQSSDRSFHYHTAFNLAEAGLEEAMWALNNNDWTKRAWQENGTSMILTGNFADSELTTANSVRGYFNIVVQQVTGAPIITAEGIVQPAKGGLIRKQLRVLARNSNLFMPPFTAITSLDLNGGEIDSYRMADGDYTTAPRRFETTVASPSVKIGDISIGSPADIYGYVTVGVGSSNAADFISGVKGTVQGDSTVAGADGVIGSSSSDFVDTNRIAYDFTQDFPLPAEPIAFFLNVLPAADANGMIVLGDPTGATTMRYQLVNYTVPNKCTLLVVGPVEIKVLADLTVGGQAAITVLNGTFKAAPKTGPEIEYKSTKASATIYAYGDVAISGNGALTGGTVPGTNISTDPTKLQILGMSSTPQDFDIGGNGNLAAAIYAPKADMKFNGGGSSGYFAGASVANTITVNGNGYRVRFPEEMADMSTSSTYRISRWLDLIDRTNWYAFGN